MPGIGHDVGHYRREMDSVRIEVVPAPPDDSLEGSRESGGTAADDQGFRDDGQCSSFGMSVPMRIRPRSVDDGSQRQVCEPAQPQKVVESLEQA